MEKKKKTSVKLPENELQLDAAATSVLKAKYHLTCTLIIHTCTVPLKSKLPPSRETRFSS